MERMPRVDGHSRKQVEGAGTSVPREPGSRDLGEGLAGPLPRCATGLEATEVAFTA